MVTTRPGDFCQLDPGFDLPFGKSDRSAQFIDRCSILSFTVMSHASQRQPSRALRVSTEYFCRSRQRFIRFPNH